MLRWPLFQISRQINDLQKATAGFKRRSTFRTDTRIEKAAKTCLKSRPWRGADRVTFSYFQGDPVLRDVNFLQGPAAYWVYWGARVAVRRRSLGCSFGFMTSIQARFAWGDRTCAKCV